MEALTVIARVAVIRVEGLCQQLHTLTWTQVRVRWAKKRRVEEPTSSYLHKPYFPSPL